MITIGIDLGGSSLRATLFEDDTARHRVEGTGGSMRAGQGERLAAELATAVQTLLARTGVLRADVLVVGAAGAGAERERDELRTALETHRLAWRCVVVSDAELAHAAAFGQSAGILLIAGTGSIALGRDDAGVFHRVGGLGWRMGDQGSGYWLGQRGLEAVGAMHDQLGPTTHLTEALCAAAGVVGLAGLVRWSVVATPANVASLAPAVLATADQGDAVAVELRAQGVAALAGIVEAAGPATTPVALAGGLLQPVGAYGRLLHVALEAGGHRAVMPAPDPCLGALALR